MQVSADVLNMPIKVAASEQACALGSAMAAAAVCKLYPTIGDAQKALGSGFEKVYEPIPENAVKYQKIYKKYSKVCDFIEGELVR